MLVGLKMGIDYIQSYEVLDIGVTCFVETLLRT